MTSFIVMDVLERAQEMERAGESVIHLEVGEPDFNTPEAVINSAIEALSRGDTHYTHSLGTPGLREAICNYYEKTYGVRNIDPGRVIVTSGTSPAFLVAMGAILECGEEVILSNPHYACHLNFVRFLEAVPRMIPVYEEDGFQYRPEAIKAALTPRTKAILINSPANPTGNLLEADRMAEIADMGRLILSDEIYHGLVYEGRARSALEFTENCIVFNGFSKLFAMTGWRLGYLIAPEYMIRPIQKMVQNFFISANSVVQAAGYTALTDPSVAEQVAKMRDTYNLRRQYMIARLREIGFGITVEPTGAFYVFANARRFTDDSYSFAFEVLENAKVGVTPGVDFGTNGEGYVRFSYANSLENITEGLGRIERYVKGRERGAGSGDRGSEPPALGIPDASIITSAEFITSAAQPEQYPRDGSPEVAFAGRSNVGKSALINCLIQRKKLVRTSRTPGRTQLINFFKINGSFLLVDLPGYGYAKVPQSLRASWGPMIETYLDSRENLRGIVQIMDLRHPPTPDDISLWSWLKEKKIPAIPILTKADKLSRAKWNPLAQAAGRILGISPADFIIFSAQTQQGRNELLCRVKELIKGR